MQKRACLRMSNRRLDRSACTSSARFTYAGRAQEDLTRRRKHGGLDGLGGSNFNFTWGLVHLLAVCFVLEECSSVRVTVLRPRADEHVFASRTDGFGMNILVEGMGRTPQNCGEWRLSIYEGERELSVQSLCTCFGDDQAFMNSCSLNVYFHHPQSRHTS